MTKRSSKNIMADSLTGMIFAAEGIAGTVVLLNGPMGCKFYHSTTSQFLSVRPLMYLPGEDGEKVPVDYNYLNEWFFRQERVPCTWLDGYDYVYGSNAKVEAGLIFLRDNLDFDLLVIINSPGAALIGDQIVQTAARILPDHPRVILESPGYSEHFDEGYENAALQILQNLLPRTADQSGSPAACCSGPAGASQPRRPAVNLLGLSIWDRYHEGDKRELTEMLEKCGITVNCVLCGGSTVSQIRSIPDADLNLVVNTRAGARCAHYLEEAFGMCSYVCSALPVGFDASMQMISDVCRILGTDAEKLKKECEQKQAYAWYKINDIYQMCGKPDGTRFALEGDAAQVLGYSRFLTKYLGMIPECVNISGAPDDCKHPALESLLSEIECTDALSQDIRDTHAELIFSDANTIASLMTSDRVFCGIEISLPGMGYTDLVPKTHLGINGALFLIEQVLNGLMSKI